MRRADNISWMEVLLLCACFFALLCGCTDFTQCASYLDEHNEQVVKDVVEIARLVPVDSEARPAIEAAYWRLTDRVTPWVREFRRSQGPVVVEIPRDPKDNKALVTENRAIEQLTQDIDFAEALPAPGGSLGAILPAVLGMLGVGGPLAGLALKCAQNASKWKLGARKMISGVNAIKQASPEGKSLVTAHLGNDDVIKEIYEEDKAQKIRDKRTAQIQIERTFGVRS